MNRTNNYVEGVHHSGELCCGSTQCSNCIFSYALFRDGPVEAICAHYGHSDWVIPCYWKNKAFLDGLVTYINGEWYEVEQ